MTYQKKIGNLGERIAADYLLEQGFSILERNFNTRFGEIDLIATKDEEVIFIEVKTRTSKTFGFPEESVTSEKLGKLVDTAMLWLQEHPNSSDHWRIDVIAILLDRQHALIDLEHFINVN